MSNIQKIGVVKRMLLEQKGKLQPLWGGDDTNFNRACAFVANACEKNSALLKCNPKSIIQAVYEAAQLKLYPGNALGQAYLVPYKSNAQMIIGYKGLLELARRSGHLESLFGQVVHEGDDFQLQYGTEPKIHHVPNLEQSGAAIIGVYAVAKLKGGGTEFEFMDMDQIKKTMESSASASSSHSPWQSHPEEMMKKSAIRRLCKRLPLSTDHMLAIESDKEFENPEDNKEHSFGDEVLDIPNEEAKVTDVTPEPTQEDLEKEYSDKFAFEK
jgi:recombination protein RecT